MVVFPRYGVVAEWCGVVAEWWWEVEDEGGV